MHPRGCNGKKVSVVDTTTKRMRAIDFREEETSGTGKRIFSLYVSTNKHGISSQARIWVVVNIYSTYVSDPLGTVAFVVDGMFFFDGMRIRKHQKRIGIKKKESHRNSARKDFFVVATTIYLCYREKGRLFWIVWGHHTIPKSKGPRCRPQTTGKRLAGGRLANLCGRSASGIWPNGGAPPRSTTPRA